MSKVKSSATILTVDSSVIYQVKYEPGILSVTFQSGDIWQYPGVTEKVFNEMKESGSIGKYYNANIKGRYEGKKTGYANIDRIVEPVEIPDTGRIVFRDGRYAVKLEYEFKPIDKDSKHYETLAILPVSKLAPVTYKFTYSLSLYRNGRTDLSPYCSGRGKDVESAMDSEALKPIIRELNECLEHWHLNDMQSGTKQQQAAVKLWQRLTGEKYSYDQALMKLDSIGLDKDRGYKYGSLWLLKPINEDLKKVLKSNISEVVSRST
jgi:hypothetical protein